MSAKMLTVACCITGSVAEDGGPLLDHAFVVSRPHAHCTVPAPKTIAPLRRAIERQVVRLRRVGLGRAAVVGERLDAADGRRGELERAGGPEPVVDVDVPLVAERVAAGGQRPRLARRSGSRPRCCATCAGSCTRAGTLMSEVPGVDDEQLTRQRVLGPPAGGGRGVARVAPGPGPGHRVGRRVEVGVLVGGERAVGRAVDGARAPARLPENLVAAEEREADARVAGRLDVRALRARPVLVVAAGDDQPVVEQAARGLSPRRPGSCS